LSREKVLLLFDEERPFWTERLIGMAGEDPAVAVSLAREGLLKSLGRGFCLSEEGQIVFCRWAAESYLESLPGGEPGDLELEELKLETALLFERGFKGFQGTKRVIVSPRLEYFPGVPPAEIFSISEGSIQWRFFEHPLVAKLVSSFPRERSAEGESLQELERRVNSMDANRVHWSPHILCINQCDYAYYWRSRLETDRWGLLNADRLFLMLVRDPESFDLEKAALDMASFSLFLLVNRHVYLPGCFDIDVHQQSAFSWWFWATGTRKEAMDLASRLSQAGRGLIQPAEPADAWTISIEDLRVYGNRAESFYEFVDDLAIPVTRGGPGS